MWRKKKPSALFMSLLHESHQIQWTSMSGFSINKYKFSSSVQNQKCSYNSFLTSESINNRRFQSDYPTDFIQKHIYDSVKVGWNCWRHFQHDFISIVNKFSNLPLTWSQKTLTKGTWHKGNGYGVSKRSSELCYAVRMAILIVRNSHCFSR